MKVCKNCKWYCVSYNENYFQCRKHAPRPVDNVTDDWPYVKSADWCGDFEPAPEPTDE